MQLYFTGKTRRWAQGAFTALVAFAFLFAPIGASYTEAANTTVDYTGGGVSQKTKDAVYNQNTFLDYADPSDPDYIPYTGSDGKTYTYDQVQAASIQGISVENYALSQQANIDGTTASDPVTFDGTDVGADVGAQTESQISGLDPTASQGQTYAMGSGTSDFASCSITAIITKLITNFITMLITNILEEKVENLVRDIFKVPTTDAKAHEITGASRAKDVCLLQIWGICILPSLNSLFYCLVNAIIQYIGQATVQWINSGFKGNPAFINDPDQFFKDAADKAAGAFINGISNGLMCEAFKAQVQLKLLTDYQTGSNTANSSGWSSANQSSSCSISQASSNPTGFLRGDFSQGGLDALRTVVWDEASNPVGAQLSAADQLWRRVESQDSSLKTQTQWSGGYLNVKDPKTGRITTPGRIIESQINQRLFNGEHRLLLANQFDQIIAALVNQLVKIALNEVLKVTK